MESKVIVILAKSVKHNPGRCIAGMDYPSGTKWIRPIGDIGEGQLYPSQTTLDDGTQPSLLDIVEVPVAEKDDAPLQPENWLVANGATWKRHADGKLSHDLLLSMVEEPDHLWLQPDIKTDRVSHAYLQGHPPSQSLYLIRIRKARMSKDGSSARLYFSHHGTHYALKVTDPNAAIILNGSLVAEIDYAIICVSLAPKFFNEFASEDQHFKLVASIMLL
jgi:hypothetical protein